MIVLKNALTGGARGGAWACTGITVANFLQGTAAALGLGAVLTRSQPVFLTLKWAGAAYLVYLGIQALRGAWRGHYDALDDVRRARATRGRRFREGFLSNITNPKVIVLYLSVLPQFLTPGVTDQGDALLLRTRSRRWAWCGRCCCCSSCTGCGAGWSGAGSAG
jgi:threonine/homoserine/homoserine lactone efflux protein